MGKTNKPRIVVHLETEDEKIIKIEIKDIVKKVGNSGYIAMPRELIGKYVKIEVEIL